MPSFLSPYPRSVQIGILVGILFFSIYALLMRPPSDFPTGKIVIIPEGVTLKEAGKLLKAEQVVISPVFFSTLVSIFSGEKVYAGGYVFERPLSVFQIAYRVSSGAYGIDRIRITFPEGLSAKEMSALCEASLPVCSASEFTELGRREEGYLFPDTYFFVPSSDASLVISILRQTFDRKIELLKEQIKNFGKPLKDVLTMASILEGEAKTMEDKRIIAGILWKRISIGMPLQVDTAFHYIDGLEGKTSKQLTDDDLKIDSPYNTYTRKGLPPTPIGNPGLGSIEAAVTPIKSLYFFYLTGSDGKFHYAKTHEEHVANKAKYLR